MNYPADFIKEVKELYPNSPEIHNLAEKGGTFLGRYLDDSSTGTGVSVDEILSAVSLEELQNKVRRHKRKQLLYRKWCKLYDQEFK